MRLMFVYYYSGDAGSAQDICYYSQVAKALGHEVVVYGPPLSHPSFNCSLDVGSADALIFIFEWTTQLRQGDHLDLARMVAKVPRERRIVIDCDGAYNAPIAWNGDYNHRDQATSRAWTDVCDSLSDKICQPTLHPLRANVRPFFFHAYNPAWEVPLDFSTKEFGMLYVGHSKFRWRPMERVLKAVEPVREMVGRIGLVGHGWDALPSWAVPMQIEELYYTDQTYLQRMGVEFITPIPFERVIHCMSKAAFNPVIYRPLFSHLRLVTCRTFETFAANTIPLLGLDPAYVREIYNQSALTLVLPEEQPEKKIADLIQSPERYAEAMADIRRHLAEKYSYEKHLQQLIEIVKS